MTDDNKNELDEIRRKAEEEESRHIEEELSRRAEELTRLRKTRSTTEEVQSAPSELQIPPLRPSKPPQPHPPRIDEPRPVTENVWGEPPMAEGGERKLAAIMFTDVKGFSRKMGEDEEGAMQLLRAHDTLMRTLVAKYNGKIIKSIGDSFMVDFSSAVNAVKCAIEVQETLWHNNAGKSDFEQIRIRIGIHLGDVIIVENDIYGDGVNIASRLEAITEPNRISISKDIYNQIRNKMPIEVARLGAISLKNIAEPVEVYQVLIESIPELAVPSELAVEAQDRQKREAALKRELEEAQKAETAKRKTERESAAARRRAEEDAQRKAKEEKERKLREDAQRKLKEEAERKEREEAELLEKEAAGERELERIESARQQAEQLLSIKDFDGAFAAVRSILDIHPEDEPALALENRIRLALKRDEAERRAAEEARQLEKDARAKKNAADQKAANRKRAIVGSFSLLAVIGLFFLYHLLSPLFRETKTIVILPFSAKSGSPELAVLGIGLAEQAGLILASSIEIRVMDGKSSLAIARFAADKQAAIRKFGYSHILTGTIEVVGPSITLHMHCADTSGAELWSAMVQSARTELAGIPDHVARKAATELGIDLPEDAAAISSLLRAASAEATSLCLQGRALLSEGTQEATSSALSFFEQALVIDDKYLLAKEGIALSLILQFENRWNEDPRLLDSSEKLARTILKELPGSSGAHTILGAVFMFQKKYSAALDALEAAVREQPLNADALRYTALTYTFIGEYKKAVSLADQAVELAPASVAVLGTLARIHERFVEPKLAMRVYDAALPFVSDTLAFLANEAGNALISSYQYDRARAIYKKRVSLNPTNYVDYYKFARSLQLAGDERSVWMGAFEHTIHLIEQSPRALAADPMAQMILALSHSRSGRFADGERYGANALRLAPDNLTILYKMAGLYAIQKKSAEALSTLKQAIAQRYILESVSDLDLFNIRQEPGFTSILVESAR